MKRLLRSRWFYALLALVALWPRHAEPPPEAERALSHALEEPIAEILAASLHANPWLAASMAVLGLWFALMTVTGLTRLAAGLARKQHRGLLRLPPLPSFWAWGDLWRLGIATLFTARTLPSVFDWIETAAPAAGMLDQHVRMLAGMLVIDGILVLWILALANLKRDRLATVFGLRAGRLEASLQESFIAYQIVFPWIFALLALVMLLARLVGYEPPSLPIQEVIFSDARLPVLGAVLLLGCVAAPIAEEMLFRGVVYSMLRRRLPLLPAMLLSGLLFAALHGNWLSIVPITLLGMMLAYAYERTGSLWGPIGMHMLHNTFLLTQALALRYLLKSAG